MNKSSLNIPVYYMCQLKEQVEFCNQDAEAWLRQNGLSNEKLLDPEERFTYAEYESLISSAIKICKQPALGLHVGQRLGVTTHGMMGYAAMSSHSIREVLELLTRFLITRTPLVEVKLIEGKDTIRMQLKNVLPLDSVQITFTEALLLTLKNILTQVSFERVRVQKISFPYPAPEYEALYHEVFACPIAFDADCGILEIALRGIDRQLKLADPTSLKQAREVCEKELEKIQYSDSFAYKTRKILLGSIGNFPSLQQLARQFHMTPRTLHRQLKKENTSFNDLLQEVSSKLAIEYLTKSDMSIQEIGFLLGYLDIANFRRAFKRWHGIPPGEYRRMNRDDPN